MQNNATTDGLPAGWLKLYHVNTGEGFYLDFNHVPPRVIWNHPSLVQQVPVDSPLHELQFITSHMAVGSQGVDFVNIPTIRSAMPMDTNGALPPAYPQGTPQVHTSRSGTQQCPTLTQPYGIYVTNSATSTMPTSYFSANTLSAEYTAPLHINQATSCTASNSRDGLDQPRTYSQPVHRREDMARELQRCSSRSASTLEYLTTDIHKELVRNTQDTSDADKNSPNGRSVGHTVISIYVPNLSKTHSTQLVDLIFWLVISCI
ncbi:hypothetical protein CERSUDRAFT_124849 [Gelatoporia subvermispora B]|uniref:WW domain-containing protein n=1 Tax=Ceriporiopsis subvermispora (strain B) TaxID=914234 RepID=M2QEV8_CERS8|nr:hypothetical protein CERSUDRAFT_124849 [Gelatoporia subvermispora B]